jgi:hypothetical protein
MIGQINYSDGRTRSIFVAIHRNGSYEPCGTITFNGRTNVAGFTYFDSYDGPALDAINLNYQTTSERHFEVNRINNKDMLHRIFVDYLPGPWGIQVLQAEFPEIKNMKAAERLHWFGSRTVGSLSFFVHQLSDEIPVHGIERLDAIRKRSVDFYMNKIESASTDQWELDGLASHGGARPKCIFSDKDGGQWLAKFNIDTDAYNYSRVEHAIALLARQCHLHVVETRSVEFESGSDVLFVKRFDRVKDSRPHKVSAFALMREDIVLAQNEGDYRMLFDLIDQLCCDVSSEREEMFRRMLFNIAINNTDDHLKNFELLLDAENNCYKMSPAYDLTVDPYPNPRVTSVFGLRNPTIGNDTIEHILTQLPLNRDMAYRIRDDIASKVMEWKNIMELNGVSEKDIQRLSKAFSFGLKNITPKRAALPNEIIEPIISRSLHW